MNLLQQNDISHLIYFDLLFDILFRFRFAHVKKSAKTFKNNLFTDKYVQEQGEEIIITYFIRDQK